MGHIHKLLILIILAPVFTMAQSNFKPGYLVSLKGDTIGGLIDYKEWQTNPKAFRFKRTNDKDFKIYTTENTSAFEISGFEHFDRFIVPVSRDQVDIGKLLPVADTSFSVDTVFLKLSIKGSKLTLLSYKDNIKTRFYLLDKAESQPVELVFRAFYNFDQSSSVQYVYRYRTQLRYLAQKYNASNQVLNMIAQLGYFEDEIAFVVQSINGDSSRPAKPKNLSGARFFAGVGVAYNSLTFTGDVAFSKNSNTVPKLSVGFDYFFNKSIQRFFLRVELSYLASEYKFYNDGSRDAFFIDNATSLDFKQQTVSIIPQAVYNIYNTDALKVFLSAGVSVNVSSYNNYSLVVHYTIASGPAYMNKYPGLAKSWMSFPIKAGVFLNKKLEIYGGYTPGSNLSSTLTSDDSNGSVNTFQAGLNYLFGR